MAKVLIAEDEEAMLEVFGEVVEDLGFHVCRARNGDEALMMALAEIPDLVVSDQMMPGRTGVEFLRALRADPSTADVPFLLMSAAQPRGMEEADHFLPKPFDIEAFEAAVRHTLQLRRRLSSAPASPGPLEQPVALREEVLNWVAHEMKTPLTAARLNTQLLQRRLEERGSEDETRRVHEIVRQLDRLQALISSVLDAARLSEGKVTLEFAAIDLAALLREVLAPWRTTYPELQIEISGADAPMEMQADPTHVKTIVDNLVSNAVKHGGGKAIQLSLERSPAAFVIQVRDQGPGIPAADLPRLFERFYRGGKGGGGHGLGLYIAAALARLHGGALSVRSTLGEGSTFTVRLPARG